MFTKKFMEVLKQEGVVLIVTWREKEANVTNIRNSYLVVKDNKILLPTAGLKSSEADIKLNPRVKVTLRSRDVEGRDGYQGTGFKLEVTAKF